MAAMARPFRAIFCEGSCVVNQILNGGMQETMVFAGFDTQTYSKAFLTQYWEIVNVQFWRLPHVYTINFW